MPCLVYEDLTFLKVKEEEWIWGGKASQWEGLGGEERGETVVRV